MDRERIKEKIFSFSSGIKEKIIIQLIKINVNYVKYYRGDNLNIYKLAIEKGYKPTKEDFLRNYFLCRDKNSILTLMKDDIEYVKYYLGDDPDIIKVAIKNGYRPTFEDLDYNYYLSINDELMKMLIEDDIEYIKHYRGSDSSIIKIAISKGYKPTIEDIKNNYSLGSNDELMFSLVEEDVEYFRYYRGKDIDIINLAIKKGYKITEEDLKKSYSLGCNDELMFKLIKEDVKYFQYYHGSDRDIIKYAIKEGYKITEEDIKNNYNLCFDDELMFSLIKEDVKYFKHYAGRDIDVIKLAIEKGYKVTEEDLKKNFSLGRNDELMFKLIKEDINFFKYYSGNDPEILSFALLNGYKPTKEDLEKNYSLGCNDELMKGLIEKDVNNFKYYRGSDINIINFAISNGYKATHEDFKKNYVLGYFDNLIKKMIEEDVNYFKYYNGDNLDIYKLAIENGYKPQKDDFERNNNLGRSDELIKMLIEEDVDYFRYYRGNNNEIYKLAIEKGYIPSKNDLERNYNLGCNDELMKRLIEEDINYFKYYHGNTFGMYKLAIEKGYIPSKKDLEGNHKLCCHDELMQKLIEKDINYIKYYKGSNINMYKQAISKGYQITKNDLNDNFYLGSDDEIMKLAIELDVNNFKHYRGKNKEIVNLALEKGYIPSKEDLKNNLNLGYNDKLMTMMLEEDVKYFRYYRGKNVKLVDLAIEKGYVPTKEDLKHNFNLGSFDKLMIILIEEDGNNFRYYQGKNPKILDLAVEKGYIPSKEELKDRLELRSHDGLMGRLLKTDINYIKYYTGSNVDLYQYALKRGYKVELNDVCSNKVFVELVDSKKIDDMIMEKSDLDLIKLCSNQGVLKSIIKRVAELRFNDISVNLLEGLEYYRNDKIDLINSILEVREFFTKINYDFDDYIQISLGSSYDWLKDIKKIINNNEVEIFKEIKDYFMINYYKVNDDDNNSFKVDKLNEMIRNYIKYPNLINSVVKKNRALTDEEMKKLKYLFSLNIEFLDDNKPNRLEELDNLDELLKNVYLKQLKTVDNKTMYEVKEVLCKILFNKDLKTIYECLNVYGDVGVLKQLKFNNRTNNELVKKIDEMIVYTSLMEDIIDLVDVDKITKIVERIKENLDLVIECSSFFSDYDNKMKYLYEQDLIQNLSVIDNVLSYDSIIDKELTNKYGIDVIDFSNKDYLLLAHVKSDSETVDELIYGKTDNKLFISTTPISYRNQVYYYNGNGSIIFATDEFPENNFICSSIENMGTNYKIKNNSNEVEEINYRTQRGVLEISGSITGRNAEVFSLRENVKFKYIVLVGGREATLEELEIASKYNLKFVMTQANKKMITNPVKIEYKDQNLKINNKTSVEQLKEIKKQLVAHQEEKKQRKIAILTDLHGLFEPTLAILEDARKNGVTEIYSLGDNIGTGPNPKEVLDLLDDYGVKSIVGNHELYMLNGVEEMREHFLSEFAYQEAINNSNWTRENLTDSQIKNIKLYPKFRELLVGDKNILLCHSIKDYNTGKIIVDSSNYDEIFQGHTHFEEYNENITTVRGAGIGDKNGNLGQAFYLILTENENGGYAVSRHLVEYDVNNLKHDINISDAPEEDIKKISAWTGIKR